MPGWVSSSAPLSRSISRHSSCERRASGTYSRPSPIARRVIRVSPCVDPQAWGGTYWSIPMTETPRAASCQDAALPIAPSPTTMTSADRIVRARA